MYMYIHILLIYLVSSPLRGGTPSKLKCLYLIIFKKSKKFFNKKTHLIVLKYKITTTTCYYYNINVNINFIYNIAIIL